MKRPDWLAYLLGYAQAWWADWRVHRASRRLGADERHCAIHGYEPIPRGCFRVCGECWHAYPTARDIVEEHNKILQEMAQLPEPPRLSAPDLEALMIPGEVTDPQVPKVTHFPPGLSMRKVKLTRLDEEGQPVGEPIPMPDMLLNVQPGRSASFDMPVPPEVLRLLFTPPAPWEPIPYQPLTVDQVDLIHCCPLCTHDW